MGKQLRVLARGTASAPIHSAHAQGVARFVGRVDDLELGTPFKGGVMPARVCSPEPTVFDQDDDWSEFTEQIRHLRQGDLWPFDEATARMAGVSFDATYGGEYVKGAEGKLENVAHKKARAELATSKAVVDSPKSPAPSAQSAKEGK